MKRSLFPVLAFSSFCLGVALFSGASSATTLLSAVDQGNVKDDGEHVRLGTNYAVGNASLGTDFRDFFIFDLSSLTGNVVTSASLDIFLPETGYSSSDTSETLMLFDVSSTSIASLVGTTGGVMDVNNYTDLGTGAVYGSSVVTESLENTVINIALSAAAITDLNAAIGTLFAVGGDLTTASVAPGQEIIFVNTQDIPLSQTVLRLETTSVPEATTLALLTLSFAGIGYQRRKRAKAE
jgi:hypothetical protein